MQLTLTLDVDPRALHQQRLLLSYLEQFDIDESPIGGLLALTDVIADELADLGNDRALLTGSAKEDKLATQMLDDFRQRIIGKPRQDATAVKPYLVKLVEKGGCLVLHFQCEAENQRHAVAQAEKAYAGCAIHQVLEFAPGVWPG